MEKISLEEAVIKIEESEGKIFSVVFRKRTTGEWRKLIGRLGVRKDVNGTGLKYDPASRQLMTVYDMQNQGWRMINKNSITELQTKGESYVIV
jgi:predicted secreted protein|tara:strand:+ start:1514 stop:1792 length:279 start_codon:yes stop_codon:yes gene_type:complete